ncbi:MAG: hypothetical protein FWH03_01885 [Firmicutes bacterium]|nr:hypothetical protein [Bacillota bacterium]
MDIIDTILNMIRKTRPFLMLSYDTEEFDKNPETYPYPKLVDATAIKDEMLSFLLTIVQDTVSVLNASLSDTETIALLRSVIEKAGL